MVLKDLGRPEQSSNAKRDIQRLPLPPLLRIVSIDRIPLRSKAFDIKLANVRNIFSLKYDR